MSSGNISIKSRRLDEAVHEGWLLKRGEHIKNWRPRYFVLFKNGALLGFRAKPDPDQPLPDPLNDFTVKNVQAVSDSLKETESQMDTEMMEESSILSEINRQTTTHEQFKISKSGGGRDMMSMADAAEAARRDKIVSFL
uniref:PH domain-containing protein n=1 Tax=Elaeophora elaphi TaxID=1147741 RepID=A0A0R3RIK0_9BILA